MEAYLKGLIQIDEGKGAVGKLRGKLQMGEQETIEE